MKAARVLRPAVPFLLASFLTGTSPAAANSSEKRAQPLIIADVVVSDDGNQPVEGLREQDFQLFENGKRQKVLSFQEHSALAEPTVGPQPAALPPNTFTNANSSPPDSINVVLLDQLNTSAKDQQIGLDAVISFISQKPERAAFAIFTLRNDDPACAPYAFARGFQIIGVLTPTSEWRCSTLGRLMLIQGITLAKDRLLAALHSQLASPHPIWLRMSLDPWTLGTSYSAFYDLYSLRGSAFPTFRGYAFTSYGRDFYPNTPPEAYDSSITWIAEIGHFLQDLPGRKSLVWISDNFDAQPIAQYFDYWFPPKFKGWDHVDPLSPTLMTHLAADRLDLARVALYPADLSGKTGAVEVKRLCPNYIEYDPGLPSTISSQYEAPVPPDSDNGTCTSHYFKLSYVAAQTGGEAFHGPQTVQDAIAHAISDESHYYSLAYVPSTAKLNGGIRNIKLTLRGKKYHLAYRRRYYADDPSTVNRPASDPSPDLYIRSHQGPLPWQLIRVHMDTGDPNDPLAPFTRWGAPETNDITFSAHVEPTAALQKASPEQMEKLQNFESFRSERIQQELEKPTSAEIRMLNKGKGVLNSLPPADPVPLQPYSIDYLLPGNQVTLKPGKKGYQAYDLEVAVVAYDALGKKVVGDKQQLIVSLAPSEVAHVKNSDLHVHQALQIPDRATVLRFVCHDVLGNHFGSLEVPMSAISSPYKRQKLEPTPATGANQPGS